MLNAKKFLKRERVLNLKRKKNQHTIEKYLGATDL